MSGSPSRTPPPSLSPTTPLPSLSPTTHPPSLSPTTPPHSLSPTTPPTSNPSTQPSSINALSNNQMLLPEQCISSPSNEYLLCYQLDAHLVGYGNFNRDLTSSFWANDPYLYAAGFCKMQGDGNFVCYDSAGAFKWGTMTAGRGTGPYRLALQNDRNIVVYDSLNIPLWESGTSTCCTLTSNNQKLLPEQCIHSPNNRYRMCFQNDAHLVGYDSTKSEVFWSNNVYNYAVGFCMMQYDGNFACYDSLGVVKWSTGTSGQGTQPYKLVVQDDRNIILYDTGKNVLWSSGTTL